MTVEMRDFLVSAVSRYMDEVGLKSLPFVATPYLDADGPATAEEALPGVMSQSAASHLMKLLYGGRMACPWLITAINRLASHVTRWSRFHDKALKRLMSFVNSSLHLKLSFVLSSADQHTVEVAFWPDADQAGDKTTTRSTSGMWLALMSQCGQRLWPIAWVSKKQLSTASATQEAEFISFSTGLRREAIPALTLIELLLNRAVQLRAFEDNTATISAIRAGYSPALRHLDRTARCALGFVSETFSKVQDSASPGDPDDIDPATKPFLLTPILQHCPTKEMRGDIFTKTLARADFANALRLINCFQTVAAEQPPPP
jgi:hypothetical protein